MGYCASWDGTIKFKQDITNEIIEECEYVFNELHYEPAEKTLTLYGNGKYHSDEVIYFLDAIKNITESGEVKFCGDDGAHWRFIFRENKWIEESGDVYYDSFVVDKDEFIGQIIDIIQDCLDEKRGETIEGEWYDEVAEKLKNIMKAWDVF